MNLYDLSIPILINHSQASFLSKELNARAIP